MIERNQNYIGGNWHPAGGGPVLDITDASTEEVFARVRPSSNADAAAAVNAARAAFDAWSRVAVAERCEALVRIADGLAARKEELTQTIAREVGMPRKMAARVQVANPVENWRRIAAQALEVKWEETIGHSRIVREPVGVVVAITPWNFPLHQITLKVAAALVAGCTVVLKPSEVAPLNAFILAEVIDAAGLPPGVFNLVVGTGSEVGEALVAHPEVDAVSFTGSSAAGRRVGAVAAQTVKRVSLELGGKSASVVLDDADLQQAVRGTLAACFLNSGQACNALSRMLVPADQHEQACTLASEALASFTVGPADDPASKLGPLVSARQYERVQSYIEQGINEGATLVGGGPGRVHGRERGFFARPTVFGAVTPTMTIAREEIFGPVLSIMPYQSESEAIAIANGTDYGLAAAVWSASDERAGKVARRLRAGQVDINGAGYNPLAPFGGFKQSGHGREAGRFGIEEFLELKSIQQRA
jgi:acyl-CoA reductase-like NAD-dependent aldehyde dehydrogenase